MQSWKKTLEGVAAMQPEHVSAYILMLEKETKMTGLVESGVLPAPDEDTVAEMYKHAHSYLKKSGYEHYEVSNFAKPGYASQHNINYWKRKPYKGIIHVHGTRQILQHILMPLIVVCFQQKTPRDFLLFNR